MKAAIFFLFATTCALVAEFSILLDNDYTGDKDALRFVTLLTIAIWSLFAVSVHDQIENGNINNPKK